jgi:ATP-dependent DNA helicase RecQ
VLDFRHEVPTSDVDFGPVLQVLGKQKLRDGQLPIILAILAGKVVLAVRPIGSGKSLCFQVPVLLRSGTGLVIEPLKVLMKDQVQALHDLQIPATFISSDFPPPERHHRDAEFSIELLCFVEHRIARMPLIYHTLMPGDWRVSR